VRGRRWTTSSKVFAALSVVSGLAAFALVRAYQADLERLRPAVGDPVEMVVASTPIARASAIRADELDVVSVPSSFAPPGRIASTDAVVGRTTLTALAPGEPVTRTRLAPPGGPIAAVAPPGLVAFPIAVDVPAGAVRPGDLVDVLATFGGHRPHTETVAEGVQVLLVMAASSIPVGGVAPAQAPTLVLAAEPDLSERLAYASAFADLSIAVEPAAGSA
jgi:Flp pilus assembly protein CpaB